MLRGRIVMHDSISNRDKRFFSAMKHSCCLCAPRSQLSSECQGRSSQGINLTNSSLSGAEDNVWSYSRTPLVCFHGIVLS